MIKSQYDNAILVVEDESVIAMTLEETLINLGYKHIDIALNPATAKEKIDSNTYDLVILDINLGNNYDGIELATVIKLKQEHTPIIFLTGNSDNLTIERAKEVEPNAYLTKPFNENAIKINLDIIFFQRTKNSSYIKNTNELKFSRSFLNNHPNFILRIDKAGHVLFSNPIISRITGKNPADYNGKTIYDSDMDQQLVTLFEQCQENAEKKKRKFTLEASMPTVLGERMMFIVVIPEFNTEKEITSIVMLMQDITDQQIATHDLTLRNKKITDSINYSKKIQEALLPTSNKLRYYLPDSCILLKPKDMVSGDFPWVSRKNNFLYIAAVDCTGHGVPGALLSVIIHFLLNEIIKMEGALLPSKVLEILHVHTKRTLKQHMPNVESSDGADIALCRFDTLNNELCFSGAHRPLIYLRDGVIQEIKGDKQPIGGEHYARKSKRLYFTNHSLPVEHNDKFLVFSDGLSDQFGGTGGQPAKFGSRNIKNMLLQCADKNSSETIATLENEFNTWKSNQKQLDDVLAICFSPSMIDFN
jgi:PAS domain S-box-containing protein